MKSLCSIRHLALDLDGTLYLGSRLFDCTLPFLDFLKERGIGRTFFTNNSARSTKQYVQKLRALGIDASPNDVYGSSLATIEYLKQVHPPIRQIFLLGTPGLADEFIEHGYEIVSDVHESDQPQAAVVGFDTTLTYARICAAAYWIGRGKLFVATHCDRVCPTDEPTILPDCGAICQMLTAATGRAPDAVLGKPHPQMLAGVMKRHGLAVHELAVVGDRLYTDIAMAHAADAMGILVLSGETSRKQAEAAAPKPHMIVADVGELMLRMDEAWNREDRRCQTA